MPDLLRLGAPIGNGRGGGGGDPMPNHDREDIVTLFHRLPMASERQAKSFVGVDECLNGREVANLLRAV